MYTLGFINTSCDSFLEIGKCFVIGGVEALLFDKLPEPFNQVQIGRIRRQKKQFDVQVVSLNFRDELSDSTNLLHSRWSNTASLRRTKWIGSRSTVQIDAAGTMGNRSIKDKWSKMVIAMVRNKRCAKLVVSMCQ